MVPVTFDHEVGAFVGGYKAAKLMTREPLGVERLNQVGDLLVLDANQEGLPAFTTPTKRQITKLQRFPFDGQPHGCERVKQVA